MVLDCNISAIPAKNTIIIKLKNNIKNIKFIPNNIKRNVTASTLKIPEKNVLIKNWCDWSFVEIPSTKCFISEKRYVLLANHNKETIKNKKINNPAIVDECENSNFKANIIYSPINKTIELYPIRFSSS